MPSIINMKPAYVCLFKKKKDVSIFFAIHGERLFPCHFISTLSCASAVIKWHFSKFALTALRFLKNSNLGAILLNIFFPYSQSLISISINGELKNSITFSRFCTTSFCYALFDLISIISYFFKKRNFLYSKKTEPQFCIKITVQLWLPLLDLNQRQRG